MTISRIPIFEHGIKNNNQPIAKDSGVIELPESTLAIQNLDFEPLSGAKPKTCDNSPGLSIQKINLLNMSRIPLSPSKFNESSYDSH
jgi:hypothetical protein